MDILEIRKLSPKERLLYFIQERESVRIKKERGDKKPWTEDPAIRSFRFTNVRRMDDKVSQWLLTRWYQPNFDHKNILTACALARLVNKIDTLEEIGFPLKWDPEAIKRKVRRLQESGAKVFSAAYMIRGNDDGGDKIHAVVDQYVRPLHKNPPEIDNTSMRRTWIRILPSYGMGSFMAGQIVADLRWASTGTWLDKHDWAPMGPGSRRGLNRVMGRDKDAKLDQATFLEELRGIIELCNKKLPSSITKRMEAIDYQSCLCEHDKHSRVILGEGRPKQRYKGWR